MSMPPARDFPSMSVAGASVVVPLLITGLPEFPPMMSGVCHTMQPGIVEVAFRHVGPIRDFAAHPERLLPQ